VALVGASYKSIIWLAISLVALIVVGGDGNVIASIEEDIADVPVLFVADISIVYEFPATSPVIWVVLVFELNTVFTATLEDEVYRSV
jgi:hypothetical protein